MAKWHTLFNPQSIAVIGASNNTNSFGSITIKNLLNGGYDGAIIPITKKYKSVAGVLAYPSLESMPLIPDVAILCTPFYGNDAILKQLDELNVQYAIVIDDNEYQIASKDMSIRVIGGRSLGLLSPWHKVNLSCAPLNARKGKIAFISQSASICSSILDWAESQQIGFSAFVSLGNATDVSFPELLDYFATESNTESILLYVKSISDARSFLSAARAAARNRRVLAIKPKSNDPNSLDIIYDSAIRRSGMLRVRNTHELFAAVETLTHTVPIRGDKIAIISNGHSPADLARDKLHELGGKLVSIPSNEDTPSAHILRYSASSQEYCEAIQQALSNDAIQALLVMHTPSAQTDAKAIATAVANYVKESLLSKRISILTNWLGESSASEARLVFTQMGIPTYRTPESAITAFHHLVEYQSNQKQLMETPTTADPISLSQVDEVKALLDSYLEQQTGSTLAFDNASLIFTKLGFDVQPTETLLSQEQAITAADAIGYPIAMKRESSEYDDHYPILDIANSEHFIMHINQVDLSDGAFSIQKMLSLGDSEEIRVRLCHDKTFGPVILFGQGGQDWNPELHAVAALPPLNMALANYVISIALRTGKIRHLKHKKSINKQRLAEFLVRLSQLSLVLPHVRSIDIHPLVSLPERLVILDANIGMHTEGFDEIQRPAIRPFPAKLVTTARLKDQRPILIRPILPEDEPLHADFLSHVSKEDMYKRFFREVNSFSHETLANLTQIDYDREMAFVAIQFEAGNPNIIGVSRALILKGTKIAEFAILIRSDTKGVGLGKVLMKALIHYCKDQQLNRLTGITMPSNQGMLKLAQSIGFEVEVDFSEGTAEMHLSL